MVIIIIELWAVQNLEDFKINCSITFQHNFFYFKTCYNEGFMKARIKTDTTSKLGWSSVKVQRLIHGIKSTRLIKTWSNSRFFGIKEYFQMGEVMSLQFTISILYLWSKEKLLNSSNMIGVCRNDVLVWS